MKTKVFFIGWLAIAILLTYSCQPEFITPESTFNSLSTERSLEDCQNYCITEDTGDAYAVYDQAYYPANMGWVDVKYFNTLTHVQYEFYSHQHPIACIRLNDMHGQKIYEGSDDSWTYEFALRSEWEACEMVELTFWISRVGCVHNGNDHSEYTYLPTAYALIPPCETVEPPTDECEEGLSIHQDGDCWVFTYVSAEAISGAEVSFTIPHITGFESCDGKEYTVNQGRGRGANTVLTWTGDIPACEEISFSLQLDPDCNRNNAGFAILWSDFKVNGVSKKGNNSNIVYDDCDRKK